MPILIDRSNTCSLLIALLFIGITATNCTSDNDSQSQDLSNITPVEIDSLNLFLNPIDHDISSPFALDILSDGRLAILDPDQKEVLIYQSDGSLDTQFGREGKGPGEFVQPRGLFINGSTVNVIDPGLQRVCQFDLDGNFMQNYNIKRDASFFGFVATGDSMEYYTVANGYNGGLIAHRDAATDSVRYFGEAVVEDPPPVNDRNAFKDAVANGEVPEAMRNDLLMNYAGNHLYAYLRAESRLQKYRDGNLVWDKEIALPVNEVIFDNFVESVQQSSTAFGILRYVDNMFTADENIYLLWNDTSEKPQQVVQVNTEGTVENIYRLPDYERMYFSSIVVDENSDRIYLSSPQSAEVYTTLLSE